MDDKEKVIALLKSQELSKEQKEKLEGIFPELKESEDERIRKELIEYFNVYPKGYFGELKKSHILAWLEKQGQILANSCKSCKDEPKFNVGDWITDGYLHGKISDVLDDRYIVDTKFGKRSSIPFKRENDYRLWTIQDAKDGDVLCLYYNNRKTFFIFKAIIGEGDYADILVHCCYTGKYQYLEPTFNGECRMHQISDGGYCLPADKEEQGILFQKMKEAGYEWDADNKELKKIHVIDEGKAEMDYCFTKMMNGEKVSSAWSEEDEKIALSIEQIFNCASLLNIVPDKIEKVKSWLKNLKDRVQPQPKQKWSEEDEEMCQETIDWFEKKCFPYALESENPARQSIKWLKSLKQRIGG